MTSVIDRRTFLCGITLGTLSAPLAAEAQQAEKIRRVGFLGPAAERVYTDSLRGLRAGLAERGYVEGKNIAFEACQHHLRRRPRHRVGLREVRTHWRVA